MPQCTRLLALGVMLSAASVHAQLITEPAGLSFPTPIDTRQPSLALHMVVQMPGSFGIGVPIRTFAYSDAVMSDLAAQGGWQLANGRLLSIAFNQSLFSQLGTNYGGNGINTFGLPDTRGRALMGLSAQRPIGAVTGSETVRLTEANVAGHAHPYSMSPIRTTYLGNGYGLGTPFAGLQPAVAVSPVVITSGIFPSQDGPFGGSAVSPISGFISQLQFLAAQPFGSEGNSRAPAQGTVMPISQNTALFSLMWNAYGGNGMTTMWLPDTRDTLTACFGAAPDLEPRVLGEFFGTDSLFLQHENLPPHTHAITNRPATASVGTSVPLPNAQPTVTVAYFIAVSGVYPSANGMRDDAGYIGEVIAMALGSSNFVPSGYLRCDGSVLSIEEYDTLFSLIGATFGGDGVTTFALPDLRGRVPIGTHLGSPAPLIPAGARLGAEATTLTSSNLPSHVHAVPCPADFGRAGGLPGQDNLIDNNDFIAYINFFFNNSTLADIGRAGGLPGSDGSLDNNDFIEFINRFFRPC